MGKSTGFFRFLWRGGEMAFNAFHLVDNAVFL